MFNIAAHLPAFLHFKRRRGQLIGANHLRCVEGDAGRGFDQYQRCGRGDGLRCRHVISFDADDSQRASLGLVLNDRTIRESHMPRICRGRRGVGIVGENTRWHESGIKLATDCQQQNLLTDLGSPPRPRTTGAGGKPV